MTILTNDCGALSVGQINYLSLQLVLFNPSFIIEKWGKSVLAFSQAQRINCGAARQKSAFCTWL